MFTSWSKIIHFLHVMLKFLKEYNGTCHQMSPIFLQELVFQRSGIVQTGRMKWRLGVSWSAPGCLWITCLTACTDRSTLWPASVHSPSARHLSVTTSTIRSDDCLLMNVLPYCNMMEYRITAEDVYMHSPKTLQRLLSERILVLISSHIYFVHNATRFAPLFTHNSLSLTIHYSL